MFRVREIKTLSDSVISFDVDCDAWNESGP
jgi:hypothetical protein